MTATKLGIWMDHEHAHLTEFTTDPMTTTTISSSFDHAAKGESLTHGENSMHRKQQHCKRNTIKNWQTIFGAITRYLFLGRLMQKAN